MPVIASDCEEGDTLVLRERLEGVGQRVNNSSSRVKIFTSPPGRVLGVLQIADPS